MSDDVTTARDDTMGLLERARAGDNQALDLLFARHLPQLQRWASGRLPRWARDVTETSDLVQEVVLGTFKRLDGFEPRGEGALQAYLRRAIINRIRNQLQSIRVRPVFVELESAAPTQDTSPL